jgi:D-alanyl-D-alanine carboxypeptidase
MIKKLLFSVLFCLILALPAHSTTTPAPVPVPGKEKTSSPKDTKERVIVIRTAKDPKVNQIKVGEKGEILIPQSTAIAGAAIAGAAAGGAAGGGAAGGGADAGALKGAEAGDDAKSGGDSNKAESGGGFKGASGSSGSGDSKTSDLSSGQAGNNSGLLGGGVPSGFSSVPDTTEFIPTSTETTTSSTSTPSSTSSTTTPSLPTAELQALLDLTVSDAGIPGAVMAVQTPTETWIGAAGKADLGDAALGRDPQDMTTDTQVRLAGVTRLFTAALIMKLVEENKIKLDDTVDQLLFPGAVPSGDQITVRMLLNHTSGLHDHETTQELFSGLISLPTIPWDPFADILPIIESYPTPDFAPPGTDVKFCSTGYYLLGLAAEATSAFSDPVENLVQTDFFGPLNLSHTALTPAGLVDQNNPFARTYYWAGVPEFPTLTDTTDWDLSFDWTNGSGVSTA